MLERIIYSHEYTYLRHLIYWFVFTFLFLGSFKEIIDPNVTMRKLTYLPVIIVNTYILIYYLLPTFLIKKKYLHFFVLFLLLLCINITINSIADYYRNPEFSYWSILVDGLLLDIRFNLIIFSFPLAIKFMKYFYSHSNQLSDLEKINQKNEIQILSDQINPHLLFNAFTAIHILIGRDNRTAKKMVNELTKYFRYIISGKQSQHTCLGNELDVVSNYLEIQKIRFKKDLNVEYSIDENSENILVPIFSIQTLVENAIKHSASFTNDSIDIKIETEITNEILKIKVINRGQLRKQNPKKNNGTHIGISNLKKRLEVLYPNNNIFCLFQKDEYVHAMIVITKFKIQIDSEQVN